MHSLLALFTGVLIAGMVALNGALMEEYGVYSSTALIHVAGLLLIGVICLLAKEKPFLKRAPWYLYLGGALGVVLTVCNNLSFGRISVSALLALGLFAQSVGGAAMDHYGLFGLPRRPFHRYKLVGITLTLAGIAAMLDGFDALAVSASLFAGLLLLIARTLNARLAEATSLRASTLFNYLIGLAVAVPVCLLLGRNEPALASFAFSPRVYIYFGGMVGVCVVLLLNYTVARVSAFSLSLSLFIGQVFAGMLIDVLLLGLFSLRLLVGGALVAAGLAADVLLERAAARKGQT